MSFKIAPRNEIKIKINVEIMGDMGKVEKNDFIATFKKLPTDTVSGIVESMKSNGDIKENDLIRDYLMDWDGVKDESGEDMPFNEDNLDKVLQIVEARRALANSFWRVQSGDVSRKN